VEQILVDIGLPPKPLLSKHQTLTQTGLYVSGLVGTHQPPQLLPPNFMVWFPCDLKGVAFVNPPSLISTLPSPLQNQGPPTHTQNSHPSGKPSSQHLPSWGGGRPHPGGGRAGPVQGGRPLLLPSPREGWVEPTLTKNTFPPGRT